MNTSVVSSQWTFLQSSTLPQPSTLHTRLEAMALRQNELFEQITLILDFIMFQLFEEVNQVVSMLKVSTHSTSLLLSYRTLLPPLLKGLQSPLSAPLLTGLFTTLRHTAFIPITLSQPLPDLIAHITLRLQKPKCDLDPAWEEESLGESCLVVNS